VDLVIRLRPEAADRGRLARLWHGWSGDHGTMGGCEHPCAP